MHENYEYADYVGVQKQQYDRYVKNRGCGLVSGICWVLAGLVLVLALAAHVS